MIQHFVVTATTAPINPVSAQTLIARSSSASDTQNLTLTGATSAPVNVTETRALTGQREVSFATNTLATLTGALLASSPVGAVTVYEQGTKGFGFVRVDTNPANNDTLVIGLLGFLQTYTFKSSLTGAANEIHLGADKFITARNIGRAINAGTGSGTDYGTGTTANSYVAGYANSTFVTADLDGTSQTIIYIRDLLAVQRQLAWSVSSSTSNVVAQAPTGGAMGTLLATIPAGVTQVFQSMNFNNPTLSNATLLAKTTPSTDAMFLGGRPASLRLYTENVSSSITAKVEATDNSGTTWYDVATGLTLDNNDQRVDLSAILCEYARVTITANANTTDSAVHMVAISG